MKAEEAERKKQKERFQKQQGKKRKIITNVIDEGNPHAIRYTTD